MKELEQPATDDLLGTRQRRPQLGLEDDPGRINAWVARGVDNGLLRPAPLSRATHTTSRPCGTTSGTVVVPLGRQSKDVLTSYLMTFDAFSRPGFHLLHVPILGRDPLDSDKRVLSHKRQQNRKSKDVTYLRKPKRAVFHWPSAWPFEQWIHTAQLL